VDINTQTVSPLTVTDDGALAVSTLPEPVNVSIGGDSGSTLTVTDDGAFAISALPEPLDVSASEIDVDLASQSGTSVDVNIANSAITSPTDIQDALEKKSQSYGQAVDTDYQDELVVDGYSTVEVFIDSISQSTDVSVEKSWDGTNYFEFASATGVTSFKNKYNDVTAQEIRVTITGTGTSGDTADVVIGAVL
jgi:hypothetical protein